MKGRKILSLALTLALILGLAVPALAAKVYPDLPADHWAKPYIDDMTNKGLFEGFEDGTFRPEETMWTSVGLTLCARLMVDEATREMILADRYDQMVELIPENYKWFRREAATCLELGVIPENELRLLVDAGKLGQPMTKADFAMYLVRAMGLEDFAKSLDGEALPFTDQADIDRQYRSFVKLLSSYGVLTGDENGNFLPDSSITRSVCATMLSRAIENVITGRKVNLELPNYTSYKWAAGTIKSVDVDSDGRRVLTLTNAAGGEDVYTLPLGVNIYLYNMLGQATDLKVGSYAKLIYATDQSTIASIRLTPSGLLSQVSGTCEKVTERVVTVDGVDYALDRFTQVTAGGKSGGLEVIDLDAGYTEAQVLANSHSTAIRLTLSGGTRQLDGILTDVTTTTGAVTTTSITVNSYNGMPTTYTLPQTAQVTADGQSVEMKASFQGKHVTLRVDDQKLGDVKSVAVDVGSNYIQGVLNSAAVDKDNIRQATVTKSGDAKKTPYEVHQSCVVDYEGDPSSYGALTSGMYVTAKVEGGVITAISAWRGMDEITGVLTGRTYGDPVVFTVTKDDNTSVNFSVPLAELPNLTILVEGKAGDITRVNTGDTVTLTVRYHQVTQIDVTPQKANTTGTLDSITFKADGTALLNVRFTDGTEKQFTASSGTTVTRDGNSVSLSDVNAGAQVALVTEGDVALSIQLTGTAARQDSVEGVIWAKDDQARTVTVTVNLNGQPKLVTIHIPSGVTILDVTTGSTITNVLRLSVGDTIQAFGAYGANSVFEAVAVTRR